MKFYTKALLFHVAKLVILQTVAYNIKTQNDFIILFMVSDAHRYCHSPFSKDRNEETWINQLLETELMLREIDS